MNQSSAGVWCNPPPPGTDDDHSNSFDKQPSPERVIDRIDPYLKSSEYIKYERRRRSRSRSRHRRRRSRSRSRRRHRRRRYSSSRSRSRSRSRRRHKRSRHSRTRSRSRSRRHRRPKEPDLEERRPQEPDDEADDDDEESANENVFKNDGSFLEMFKKMQEEQMKQNAEAEAAPPESKTPIPPFGKRRGGKVLKTGMVQKSKNSGQEDSESQDAWALYMKEVKRYKEACCDDDSKTRLLVK